MDIKQDLFNLKYSNNFVLNNNEELNIDLSLDSASVGTSSIVGTVLDELSQPVEGATIKLFDDKGMPYLHTVTNAQGQYSFDALKANSYSITCVKEGYVITVPSDIVLLNNEIKTHNFVISSEPTLTLSTIAGIILQNGFDNAVIGGATVYLLDAVTKDIVASTTSADDGEYVFYDVQAGNYLVVATKLGYTKSNEIEVTAGKDAIINLNIKLSINPVENVGTISGIVSHNGIIIPNAFVGLYQIVDGREVLVATTKTNASGLYMFGKVEKGEYKVKAKVNSLV